MKNMYRLPLIYCTLLLGGALQTGCSRSDNDVWENTKSAGRHMQRGFKALAGDSGQSRQIRSRDEFQAFDEDEADGQTLSAMDGEFIPIPDNPQDELAMSEGAVRQPQESPGEPGSSIPAVEAFQDPATLPHLRALFRPIYFDYDSSQIKSDRNLQTLHEIADYMRSHPNLYVVVEGHTDERGPRSYNLALGSRRASGVRHFLVDLEASPDNLFTVSYGKERPVVQGHGEESWAQNRRAEFKVYEQPTSRR